jgi:hypothetical protein
VFFFTTFQYDFHLIVNNFIFNQFVKQLNNIFFNLNQLIIPNIDSIEKFFKIQSFFLFTGRLKISSIELLTVNHFSCRTKKRLRQLKGVRKAKKFLCCKYLDTPKNCPMDSYTPHREANITSKGPIRKFLYDRIQFLQLFKI